MVKDIAKVKAAWKFFHERNFTTLYCSPKEFKRATGEALPEHDVIENFGKYVKLLQLQDKSYTSGQEANVLITTIRESNSVDQGRLNSITRCALAMDENWFKSIYSSNKKED